MTPCWLRKCHIRPSAKHSRVQTTGWRFSALAQPWAEHQWDAGRVCRSQSSNQAKARQQLGQVASGNPLFMLILCSLAPWFKHVHRSRRAAWSSWTANFKFIKWGSRTSRLAHAWECIHSHVSLSIKVWPDMFWALTCVKLSLRCWLWLECRGTCLVQHTDWM